MSQYIAHILNNNADSINVYEQTNPKSSMFNISSLAELNILNESDSLLVLIPSSTVTSYEFEENKSLSKQINIANFISEVDSSFADPVSSNDYFLHFEILYVGSRRLIYVLFHFLVLFQSWSLKKVKK